MRFNSRLQRAWASIIKIESYRVTGKGCHSHRVCRTISEWNQNEMKGSTRQFVLNQAIEERFKDGGDQAAHKRGRLSKHMSLMFLTIIGYQAIKDLS